MPLPILPLLNFNQVVEMLLKSRSDATVKGYLRILKKFIDSCRGKQIPLQLPFSVGIVSLYILKVKSLLMSQKAYQAGTYLWFH